MQESAPFTVILPRPACNTVSGIPIRKRSAANRFPSRSVHGRLTEKAYAEQTRNSEAHGTSMSRCHPVALVLFYVLVKVPARIPRHSPCFLLVVFRSRSTPRLLARLVYRFSSSRSYRSTKPITKGRKNGMEVSHARSIYIFAATWIYEQSRARQRVRNARCTRTYQKP